MTEKTLLLVEDSPDDEALIRRALKKNEIHANIVVAHDGAEAVDLLLPAPGAEPRISLPTVILMDLKMPRLGGHEALERIRGDPRTRNVPVVVFTSSSERRDIERSYELGANSYVRKPVEFEQFSTVVGRLGLYWLSLNEPRPSEHDASRRTPVPARPAAERTGAPPRTPTPGP